ncbi:MAG TPA: tetratricopeptide repeat protein [Planktothrix sp.]
MGGARGSPLQLRRFINAAGTNWLPIQNEFTINQLGYMVHSMHGGIHMCSSVPEGYDATPIKPFTYPVWIKAFAGLVAVAFFVSLCFVPRQLAAAVRYKKAEADYQAGDANAAATNYEQVLDSHPNAEAAKIGAAEAYFSMKHEDATDKAMALLSGVNLDKHEWARLKKVMPAELSEQFTLTDKDGKSGETDKAPSKSDGDSEDK